MKTDTPELPLPHDPRQPRLIDPIPLPPTGTTTKQMREAMLVADGVVRRLAKCPKSLIELVVTDAVTAKEFHKASLAVSHFKDNTEGMSKELKSWILSSVKAELERPADTNGEVPQ